VDLGLTRKELRRNLKLRKTGLKKVKFAYGTFLLIFELSF
jgi:hypothetical protein